MKVRLLLLSAVPALLWPQSVYRPAIPKAWDEAALADWATPVAGLNIRPTHISEKEYYSLAIENLRTYPVYFPGREPEGYWEMLQHIGPKPLIEPEKLKTGEDWIAAGRTVFGAADDLHVRTLDPRIIAAARNPETFAQFQPLPDGTTRDLRWIPTRDGVGLTQRNCANCHLAYTPDGTAIPGGPLGITRSVTNVSGMLQSAKGVLRGIPFFMGAQPLGTFLYQAYGVPWRRDDINERLKAISQAEFRELRTGHNRGGAIPRWNGSLYFPTKVPDLIGIKDRKYIDHTGTHLHRGIGDLMRYAALVSFAESTDFGPYRMLSKETGRVQSRLPDEALYAMALYIYSLQPPANPNAFDARARAGQQIFAREGCPGCHTPPLYTNNKLTLAKGFTPPQDRPASLDLMLLSVGTDPGLALATSKGTGYYKVPSLKGVWYRGHYLHDGSAASLEEMFDPGRLKETHVPGGWMPAGAKTHALQGHEFGLRLEPEERQQLVAFLRTL